MSSATAAPGRSSPSWRTAAASKSATAPSGRDPCRQGSTEAEPVLEGAQRVQPDMRHGLVATPSHLRTVLLQFTSRVPCWLGDPTRRERQNPLPGR